jgi:hypothetical protein
MEFYGLQQIYKSPTRARQLRAVRKLEKKRIIYTAAGLVGFIISACIALCIMMRTKLR